MSLDWDLIWTILQVVALLIIAREIDKRIRKRKKKVFKLMKKIFINRIEGETLCQKQKYSVKKISTLSL